MIDRITRVFVALLICIIVFLAFQYFFQAVAFIYATQALGVLVFVLALAFCGFLVKEFSVGL